MNNIYLDNAASTKIDDEVLNIYIKELKETYANASSKHQAGLNAKIKIDQSRKTIAKILNCKGSEIIFTGSGTESNNIAILGVARSYKKKGNHIITSQIEHPSVLECFKKLETEGFKVTYLNPNKNGKIEIENFKKHIKENTIFTSIMYTNNIIGSIQPIKEIGEICRKNNIIFHTDACQAAQLEDIDTKALNVDLLTLNGSKMHGPKGVGALFINQKLTLSPIIFGSGHEKGLRSGTQNTPSIISIAKALEIAKLNKDKNYKKITSLKYFLIKELEKNIPSASINGGLNNKTPHIINIQFKEKNAHQLPLLLSEKGIFISSGSACKAGSSQPSKTLSAIGLNDNENKSSIRISLSKYTTEKEIITLVKNLKTVLE